MNDGKSELNTRFVYITIYLLNIYLPISNRAEGKNGKDVFFFFNLDGAVFSILFRVNAFPSSLESTSTAHVMYNFDVEIL